MRKIRKRRNKQRKIIVISLIAFLFIMVGGYAAFQTNLNIAAKGNIINTPDECFEVSDNGDGTGTITNYDASCGSEVKIPERINNLTITKISAATYTGTTFVGSFALKGLTKVILPDTLIEIGSYAFAHGQFETITIPQNVVTISGHAFASGSLTSINLNEGLETIGTGAFEYNNLTDLVIPKSVKNLNYTIASGNLINGDSAFIYARDENGEIDDTTLISFGDRKRKQVVIPSNVKIIISSAFVSDDEVEQVIIPDSVTDIRAWAFWSMPKLSRVDIGFGIENISSSAFHVTPNLDVININRKENAISGEPWGADNATVNWTGTN